MTSRLKVVVVDYGVGNTHSVANAVAFLGYAPSVTADPAALDRADVLVLPGVGAFEPAMQTLRARGLVDLLAELVIARRKPILGICLGMQLMAEDSEENGHHVGLGWIPGHVRRLRVPSEYSVPHVGWNDVQLLRRDPLFSRTGDTPNFYFDHSYHFACEPAFQAAVCDYAGPVTAAVQRDNVFGVQFHPEKSQASGLKLLRGFFVSVGG
ncbi:MAG TPA: imidazole glycerol phosphate synthase subunit HisH [Polyangia bacterium]|jgi:glutamine amidotransferase